MFLDIFIILKIKNNIFNNYKNGLISVSIRLVRAFDWDADVVGLLLAQYGELSAKVRQMQLGNLFIQMLREEVHIVLVFAGITLLPELELGDGLVGE